MLIKKIGALVLVFMSGFVCSMNLVGIKYGSPAHYEAGWHKVAFAVLLAFFFGAVVLKRE